MIADSKPYPAMKDSGVECLGEVPEHWEVAKLRSILRSTTSRNRPDLPLLSVVREKGVIVRDVSDLGANHNFIPDDLSNYKVVREGQFAMNKMKAWQGSYGVSQHEGIVSPAYFVFNLNGVSGDFFNRAIRSKVYVPSFARASDGVRIGQWDLAQDRMREIGFFIPPVAEQAAIVRYLDYVDRRVQRLVRAKRKLIALLTEQKQAIIHRAVTRGLDPDVPLKDSGVEWLGQVPEHWEVRPLKFMVPQVTVGIVIQPARLYVASGIPCLRSLNISSGVVSSEQLVYISSESNAAHRKSQIFSGDIVVVRTGQAGVAAIVTPDFDGANCIDLLIIRSSDRLISEYLLTYLNSWSARTEVQYRSVGAIQAHYNTGTLANLTVPTPPVEEQREILSSLAMELDPLDEGISRAEREIELLDEYRTRLVSDVVTGKLDVRDAAAALPEVDPLEGTGINGVDGQEEGEGVKQSYEEVKA